MHVGQSSGLQLIWPLPLDDQACHCHSSTFIGHTFFIDVDEMWLISSTLTFCKDNKISLIVRSALNLGIVDHSRSLHKSSCYVSEDALDSDVLNPSCGSIPVVVLLGPCCQATKAAVQHCTYISRLYCNCHRTWVAINQKREPPGDHASWLPTVHLR